MSKLFIKLSSLFALLLILAACGAPAATQVTETQSAIPATEAPQSAQYTDPCTPENASASLPDGKLELSIGTGGTGGVFFPYGAGLAKLLGEKLANAEVSSQETGGSVDNMKFVQDGSVDFGMSTVDSAYNAITGVDAYADTGKVPACAIAVLYTSFFHVVALKDSGITSIADMKGKHVSVGSAGSSTEGLADRILAEAGLDPKTEITRENFSVADSVTAMKDNKIDAFFWIGGLPTSAVTDLASTPDLPILFLDVSEFVKPLREKFGPVYSDYTLPAGMYAGQDADVPGIGIGNILFVNANMNEQLVYDTLTAIFDNLDQVHTIHPEAKKLTLESAVVGSSIPFHPGAIRFYMDRGVKLP